MYLKYAYLPLFVFTYCFFNFEGLHGWAFEALPLMMVVYVSLNGGHSFISLKGLFFPQVPGQE